MLTRKHIRYQLELPAIFSWKGGAHTQKRGAGLTRDLSIVGAFVCTDSPPPLQAHIQLEAILPPSPSVVDPLRISGKGRVVRVTPLPEDEARCGFAVVGKSFTVRRGEKSG